MALLKALIQTPHRFRTKRQLWEYSGLGLETRTSGEYRIKDGQLQHAKWPPALRGLNQNHNHDLKAVFKSAATVASTSPVRSESSTLPCWPRACGRRWPV